MEDADTYLDPGFFFDFVITCESHTLFQYLLLVAINVKEGNRSWRHLLRKTGSCYMMSCPNSKIWIKICGGFQEGVRSDLHSESRGQTFKNIFLKPIFFHVANSLSAPCYFPQKSAKRRLIS